MPACGAVLSPGARWANSSLSSKALAGERSPAGSTPPWRTTVLSKASMRDWLTPRIRVLRAEPSLQSMLRRAERSPWTTFGLEAREARSALPRSAVLRHG